MVAIQRPTDSQPYYGATTSIPARPEKIFFRKGTPELARPCRLFGRRNQRVLAAHGTTLKQKLSAVQRQ